jgi:hypothetical protein
MSRTLPALLAILAVGCQSPTIVREDPLPVPGSRELRIGDEVPLVDTPYLLRLEAVAGDSRCPAEAVCVWAGEVQLRAVLAARPGMGLPDRQLDLRSQVPVVANGLEFRITATSPEPHAGRAIPQADYRLTIAIRTAP